jgi:hypothetical protein
MDKSRFLTEKYHICLKTEMSSFPILPIEAFTSNYKDVHKVELEFRPRRKKEEEERRNRNEKPIQQQ